MNSDKRVVPRGIPTITYARILNPINGRGGDVLGDGNSVTILDSSQVIQSHSNICKTEMYILSLGLNTT